MQETMTKELKGSSSLGYKKLWHTKTIHTDEELPMKRKVTNICSRKRLEYLKDKLDRFNNNGDDCRNDDSSDDDNAAAYSQKSNLLLQILQLLFN